MRPFSKPALTLDEQLTLLASRGLASGDSAADRDMLAKVGYYRLSGYTRAFQDPASPGRHQFRTGVGFADVVALYDFDRRLRLITLGAIERVEVAFRAHVTNGMSRDDGPHWFMNPACFESAAGHAKLLEKIAQEINHEKAKAHQRSVAVRHYYDTYSSPEYPPGWVVLEELSLGTVSRLYALLRINNRRAIGTAFSGLDEMIVTSWMRSVSYTRNVCAHHARLWNRGFTIRPVAAKALLPSLKLVRGQPENDTFYMQAAVLKLLLDRLTDAATYLAHLKSLVAEREDLQQRMGFPVGWATNKLWVD